MKRKKKLTLFCKVISEIENVSTIESNRTAFLWRFFFLGHKEHISLECSRFVGIFENTSNSNKPTMSVSEIILVQEVTDFPFR